MSNPKTPGTTAIRAFAAGMRASVGIRSELLVAQSLLLALCDALDAERAANAEMRPVISKTSPIDHARRRATLVQSCAAWLKMNGLAESRALYLANFVERNCERWAEDRQRPAV